MEVEVHDLEEAYYHKATVGFEEGSTQSLLLKRVQASKDGKFLFLHDKWPDEVEFDMQEKEVEEVEPINYTIDRDVDHICRNMEGMIYAQTGFLDTAYPFNPP